MISSEHISGMELAGFRAGRLDGARTVEIAGHLEVCGDCAGRFLGLEAPAWNGLPLDDALSADHARFEELIEYLDGDLEDREILEAHLAACGSCAGDLTSLRISRIETSTEKRYFRSRWMTRLANLGWQGWWLWPATALLVLIALGWWLHEDREPPIVRREPVPDINKDTVPEPSPELLIAIVDGGRTVGLDSGGRLIGLDGLPEDLAGDVARALKGERLRSNRGLRDLVSADGGVRSGAGAQAGIRLIAPTGTMVRDARPGFRWAAVEGASGYSVTVADERFNVVAESGRVEGTQWRPESALERGRVYQWQVTAYDSGGAVGEGPRSLGLFRVIGAGELASIREVEAETDSSLAKAVLYARAGLVDEARRELGRLGEGGKLDRLRRAIIPGG